MLAREYANLHPFETEREKNAFLLGVWIPDTRFLDADYENPTGVTNSIKEVIAEKDPIKKGMRFFSYIHQFEKKYFEDVDDYYENMKSDDVTWEIVFRVLQDSILGTEVVKNAGTVLINDKLYTEFNISKLTEEYATGDLVIWFYTVFFVFMYRRLGHLKLHIFR